MFESISTEISLDDITVPETIDGIVSPNAYNRVGASVPYYWNTGMSTTRMTNYLLLALIAILILIFSFRGKN